VRILTLGGLAGGVLFASIAILCAALRPDYSHIHHFISELGATGTRHAWLMNYVGFVPAGLLLAGFGASLRESVAQHRLATIGALLVGLFGGGVALSGLFSCDVGCPQVGGSTQNFIHDKLGPLTFVSGSLGAISLGIRFRSLPRLRSLWAYSIASGLLGLCLLGAVASTLESREFSGLWQRLLLAVLFGWCAIVGFHLFLEAPEALPPEEFLRLRDADDL
jgi:hypothetical membrane protein